MGRYAAESVLFVDSLSDPINPSGDTWLTGTTQLAGRLYISTNENLFQYDGELASVVPSNVRFWPINGLDQTGIVGEQLVFWRTNPDDDLSLWLFDGESFRQPLLEGTGEVISFGTRFTLFDDSVVFHDRFGNNYDTVVYDGEAFTTFDVGVRGVPFATIDDAVWFYGPGAETWRHELYTFDGESVAQVTDLAYSQGGDPTYATRFADGFAFKYNPPGVHETGANERVMFTDGTAVVEIARLENEIRGLTVFGEELFFTGHDGTGGQKLLAYDGNEVRVFEFAPGATDRRIFLPGSEGFREVNGELIVVADIGIGSELYAFDGENIRLLRDINPGAAGSSPGQFTEYAGMLVFSAFSPAHGRETWYYDGETVGLLAEVEDGPGGQVYEGYDVLGGDLVFSAVTTDAGHQVWRIRSDPDAVDEAPAAEPAEGEVAEPVVADDDQMIGGDDRDEFAGGDGEDWAWGLGGDDSLDGGAGGDHLYGNRGDDWIGGGEGDDVARGHVGNDALEGGAGADEFYGGGDDELNGNSGSDLIAGGAGDDIVRGQGGPDLLLGDVGNDTLVGHQGFDTLRGGAGGDVLIGGMADDSLTGGAGADVFTFGADAGTDTITDFEQGVDRLAFDGLAGFAALEITVVDGGTQVSFAGTTVMVVGVDSLVAGDFGL